MGCCLRAGRLPRFRRRHTRESPRRCFGCPEGGAEIAGRLAEFHRKPAGLCLAVLGCLEAEIQSARLPPFGGWSRRGSGGESRQTLPCTVQQNRTGREPAIIRFQMSRPSRQCRTRLHGDGFFFPGIVLRGGSRFSRLHFHRQKVSPRVLPFSSFSSFGQFPERHFLLPLGVLFPVGFRAEAGAAEPFGQRQGFLTMEASCRHVFFRDSFACNYIIGKKVSAARGERH